MNREIKKRKKRFWVLCLAAVLLLCNAMPMAAMAATYRDGSTNTEAQYNELDSLSPNDTIMVRQGISVGASTTVTYCNADGNVLNQYVGMNLGNLEVDGSYQSYAHQVKGYSEVGGQNVTGKTFQCWKVITVQRSSGDGTQVKLQAVFVDAQSAMTNESNGGTHAGTKSTSTSKQEPTPELTPTPTPTPHNHSFEWTVTEEPTKTEDGLEEYKCRECGAVEASQPISAYMFRVKELSRLVAEAPQDGSVAYDFIDLSAISDYVLAKMAERNDVAVTVSFTYGGEAHSITFPAGTDYAAVLEDADTLYGFYGVAAKLGLTVE